MAFRSSNLVDVVAQFASSVGGRGCYLVLQIILARSLGPREFGLYAIGWTVAGLVGTFAPAGMPQAVLRFGISGRRALDSAPMIVTLLAGLVSYVVLVVAARPIAERLFGDAGAAPVIIALAPSVPLLSLSTLLTVALRASKANVASAAASALSYPLYLVGTLLFFAIGFARDAATAGYAYDVALAISLAPAAWMLARKPVPEAVPATRALLRFGWITMLISSANLLNLWADRVVVGMMTDVQAVGIYQVASQLAVVAIVLRSAVVTVFESRVPKPVGGRIPDVTREFLAGSRLLLHLSVPGLICLTMTAGFWTVTLFGAPYRAAALPLVLLVIGQLGLTLFGPAVNALSMTGEEKTALRLTIGTSVLNVAANVALIPFIGLAGSAVASGLANVAVGGISFWRLRRTGRLAAYFPRIVDVLIAAAVCTAVPAIAVRWLGVNSVMQMVGVVAIAYLVYAAVVLMLCRGEDEAVEFLRATVRRKRRQEYPAP